MDEPPFNNTPPAKENMQPTKGNVIQTNSARRLRRATYASNQKKGLTNINNVLSELTNKLGLDRRLKEHAFMDLWPVIVGDVLAQKSRPIFIDNEGYLVVTVKEAPVGQELSLQKLTILKQLKKLAYGLGLTINNIRFDLKSFHNLAPRSASIDSSIDSQSNLSLKDPSKAELDALVLTESELNELKMLAANLQSETLFSPDKDEQLRQIPERMLSLFEQELRLLKWRKLKGFPICKECGISTDRLFSEKFLCNSCYYESFEKSHETC